MSETKLQNLLGSLKGAVEVQENRVKVIDEGLLRDNISALIYQAVFGDGADRGIARWLVWEIAQEVGIRPASIHELYLAKGRGEAPLNFTVPAMNLRMLAYDSARAVFRAAKKLEAGAFIFEIARSEMSYTDQRPSEYVSSVLAAAIKEGYRGPVFIQGDHFQVSAKKFQQDPESEKKAIRDLIEESIAAGFFNIDIDTSTLVDISKPDLDEQQKLNYELCAEFNRFIRAKQPAGVTISVGGEIGEVGHKNSTEEDLEAFMQGFNRLKGEVVGLSKLSIQTGTSHGGVVLPDGTLAQVAIDFDVLKRLGELARKKYGMGGVVQHGASTLPDSAFHKFVEVQTCEVHLATAFQNMIMEHKAVPEELRQEMYEWLKVNAASERKPTDTEAQFIYKTRKKAVGPFKKHFWTLPEESLKAIGEDLEKQFTFLFEQLNIKGTRALVDKFVRAPEIHHAEPLEVKSGKKESVDGLAD
ncbi:MAG: fructose-1,6-bisphosphate aldolase [Candidatus Saccharicenans subterraneus]|uniref:Fructose-1,6-bisphosphate aldolase n=1 Tax=Candidatus Saccharicenans subterraneus TaxID=2508984 RepID=A0A3E2BJS9_9BACT|nr:MAG: fructose-1,6-bisphosphate aldolase [Candidatus Saccharicenans subterraneum]